jgi:hypothetical protein
MSSYVIAIPSYQRANILKEKTLSLLINGKINKSKIYIFVANEEEKTQYESAIPKTSYNKIIVGVKGINEQRKFIMKYFPEGKHIVSIDDDVSQLLEMDESTEKMLPITNIAQVFETAFKDLKKHKLYLWGLFPTPNPFYMVGQAAVTTKLRFIIATVYGFINRHDMILKSKIEEKEDVENSILHYIRDKGVIRYNRISFKTKFKNCCGGLGGIEKRFKANEEAAAYLCKTYPEYARLKVRKNGMHEVVLRDYSKK